MLDDKIFTFNRYMKQKFGGRVARISMSTGFDCPWNKCIFCRKESFSPNVSVDMTKADRVETLERSMNFLKNRYGNKFFAAYFQSGTSTFGDKETLAKMYREAASIKGVVAMIFSTRPDYLGKEEIQLILDCVPENIDEIWIELGLQSTNDCSLKWINRGHDAACYFKAIENVEKYGENKIKVAPHIILGLPGETEEDMLATVLQSTQSPVAKGLKLHHLQIHNMTPLEKIYAENPFPLLSVEKYIEITAKIIAKLPPDKVLFRLFTTAPAEYLIAPKWNLGTQEALRKFEEYLDANHITQGCERCME